MSKQIIYGADAKAKIKEGVDAVANAVKSTLGPRGMNVLLQDGYDDNRVTKDGVTVARNITLTDKVANAGASLIKKVANKVASEAGDGTTTSTVIAQAIIEEGSKLIAAGIAPISLKRGIDVAVEEACKFLERKAVTEGIEDALERIATISANGDAILGKLVSDVVKQVGKEGVVSIQTSNTTETYIEKVNGLRFDKGYTSQYFITDPEKLTCELKDPYILITDQAINNIRSIEGILRLCNMENRPLLIIADNVDGEAMMALVVNNMRRTLQCCVVKAPNFGDRRTAELGDIAAVTGGKLITPQMGVKLEQVTPEMLGTCKKVVVTAKETTLVDGNTNQTELEDRIKALETQLNGDENEYTKNQYRERLARLKGGVAVLYVGAYSEIELNEKKDRLDDALCACRATYSHGYLPGGGIAYLNAAIYLQDAKASNEYCNNKDVEAGYNTIVSALKAPIVNIINNGYGDNFGDYIAGSLIETKKDDDSSFNTGYDAAIGEKCDMIDRGIIDPAKVAIAAIQNAASIAGTYLTTGCIVIDENEKKEDK